MGRGGAVGEHDLGVPDDPASRWVLHLADKIGSGKRGQTLHSTDVVRAYVNSSARLACGWGFIIRSCRSAMTSAIST